MKKKLLSIVLACSMLLTLGACGGPSGAADNTDNADTQTSDSGSVELKSFKFGYLDEGKQDATSVALRTNIEAAVDAVGAEGVSVQPTGSTPDDYLDALDILLGKGVDVVALPWASFMFQGTPAAVKKCEDAGVYYGFYWSVEVEALGEEALGFCQDSKLFLGAFYQTDNTAAYDAMKILHENGCDHLGYIGLPADNELRENSRDYGVFKACEEFGMEILAEQRDFSMTTSAEGGAATVENFVTAYPEMDGIIIAGMTQFVMPGVNQAIKSKSLENFKVAAIDFPDTMDTYANDGTLVYDAGGHITGPVYLAILAANAINGTPLIEKGQSFNQQYIELTSSEEVSDYVKIINEVVYNKEEVQHCIKALNPDFTLDEFVKMVESYSYNDIMTRHYGK